MTDVCRIGFEDKFLSRDVLVGTTVFSLFLLIAPSFIESFFFLKKSFPLADSMMKHNSWQGHVAYSGLYTMVRVGESSVPPCNVH